MSGGNFMRDKIIYFLIFLLSAWCFWLPYLNTDVNKQLVMINTYISLTIPKDSKVIPRYYGRTSFFQTKFVNKSFNKEKYIHSLKYSGWEITSTNSINHYEFKKDNIKYILDLYDNHIWGEYMSYED